MVRLFQLLAIARYAALDRSETNKVSVGGTRMVKFNKLLPLGKQAEGCLIEPTGPHHTGIMATYRPLLPLSTQGRIPGKQTLVSGHRGSENLAQRP